MSDACRPSAPQPPVSGRRPTTLHKTRRTGASPGRSAPGGEADEIGTKADFEARMSALGGIAPWKAHEVRWPGMAATVKLSQQPRSESCVVPGTWCAISMISCCASSIARMLFRVHDALGKRLGKFGLTLEPSKTKLVEFGRFAQRHAGKRGRKRPQTIYFLGLRPLLHAQPKGRVQGRPAHGRSHDFAAAWPSSAT